MLPLVSNIGSLHLTMTSKHMPYYCTFFSMNTLIGDKHGIWV